MTRIIETGMAGNSQGASDASAALQPGRRPVDAQDSNSWFAALAKAWGNTLDQQATRIAQLSDSLEGGGDMPSTTVQLTAESLRMQFLSNSASTCTNSVGQALETLGRKQ